MFEGIKEALHHEMDQLDEKFAGGAQMSGQELDHIDKMAHALKSLATYEAMLSGDCGGSYAKVRNRVRYIENPDGYSRRY